MFRTIVKTVVSSSPIHYQDGIMTLGSCFSENIGRKLQNAFFDVDINPFGVLFNPVSVANSVQLLLDNKHYTEADLFQNGSLFYSFDHSTLFSGSTVVDALATINQRLEVAVENLQKAKFLLVTLGTAWVFDNSISRITNRFHGESYPSLERWSS